MLQPQQDLRSKPSTRSQQVNLKETLQLPANSLKITEMVAGFICEDMCLCSVVEKRGVRQQTKVAESHCIMVSRKALSEKAIPNM